MLVRMACYEKKKNTIIYEYMGYANDLAYLESCTRLLHLNLW
jgi:hypothetical protein